MANLFENQALKVFADQIDDGFKISSISDFKRLNTVLETINTENQRYINDLQTKIQTEASKQNDNFDSDGIYMDYKTIGYWGTKFIIKCRCTKPSDHDVTFGPYDFELIYKFDGENFETLKVDFNLNAAAKVVSIEVINKFTENLKKSIYNG